MTQNLLRTMQLLLGIVFLFSVQAASNAEDHSGAISYSIVYSARVGDERAIYLSDEDAKSPIKVVGITGDDGYPSVSPNGKQLAFYGKYDDKKTWSIHKVNMDGSNVQRLTHVKEVWDSAPSWSPDGKTIVFAREYNDPDNGWQEEVWLMNEDGSNQRQLKALAGRAPSFMQDGRIIYHSKAGPSQISIANIDGSDIVRLTDNEANDWSPKPSPDGSRVLFISDRDGNREIYVMDVDGANQSRITSNDVDDWDPAWSVDGSHIYFASESGERGIDIYKAKSDGSEVTKIVENALQASTVMHVDLNAVGRLVNR